MKFSIKQQFIPYLSFLFSKKKKSFLSRKEYFFWYTLILCLYCIEIPLIHGYMAKHTILICNVQTCFELIKNCFHKKLIYVTQNHQQFNRWKLLFQHFTNFVVRKKQVFLSFCSSTLHVLSFPIKD